MTKILNTIKTTSVWTHKICSMPKVRVVKIIATGRNWILIACSNSQPIAWILFDFEGHFASFVSFFLEGRLKKSEMVVIPFWWFNQSVTYDCNTSVFKLITKLEIYLTIKDRWIISCLLQRFQKSIDFCPNGYFFGFEFLLYLWLNCSYRVLNLITAYFCFLILRIKGDSC